MWSSDDVVRELGARGDLWESAPGLVGLRGDTLELYRALENRIASLAARMTRSAWKVPAGVSLETLARADYFASFPQWLTAAGHMSDDPQVLERVALSDAPAEAARSAVGPPSIALAPAVCYHVYAALAGREIDSAMCLTVQDTCWRHEGERMRPLERGWAFTMREVVCLGSAAMVEEFRIQATEAAAALARSLGLDHQVEVAADPFFAPTGRGRMLLQRMKELKHEILLPIGAGRRVAAASVNQHERFFGEAFEIRLADGGAACSGCLAFGIERWLLAYLVAHGTNSRGWPILASHPTLAEA